MPFLKNIDYDDKIDFPHDEDDDDEDVDITDNGEDDKDDDDPDSEKDKENIGELEKIESKMEKGEDVALTSLEYEVIPKTQIVYSCPRCRKIFFNKKWVKDSITDLFTVHIELAYCPKCVGKNFVNFIGSIEIYDKNLKERKDQIIETARQVERALEDAPPFENIIDITEKNGILFIFTNTTRLALEIGKMLRQEFGGGIQYEWFERNQFLRVKWRDQVDNQSFFKERIQTLKDRRFGMFSFEDEE